MVATFKADLVARVRQHCTDMLLEHGFNRDQSLTLVAVICMLIDAKVDGNEPNKPSVAAISGSRHG